MGISNFAVICSNGYSNEIVFSGSKFNCDTWVYTNCDLVQFGLNEFFCLPDDESPNGYDSNGDGKPNYYSVKELT